MSDGDQLDPTAQAHRVGLPNKTPAARQGEGQATALPATDATPLPATDATALPVTGAAYLPATDSTLAAKPPTEPIADSIAAAQPPTTAAVQTETATPGEETNPAHPSPPPADASQATATPLPGADALAGSMDGSATLPPSAPGTQATTSGFVPQSAPRALPETPASVFPGIHPTAVPATHPTAAPFRTNPSTAILSAPAATTFAPFEDCGPTSADLRPRGRPRRRREAGASSVASEIHRVVKEQPGIHFRALARAAGLTSAGQLRHHLDRLARQGQLIELQDGGYKRFFATGEHEPALRPGLARFSRSIPRRIGQLLLTGPLNRTELRRRLGCADSTLGYHLNRMLLQGDLKRRRGRSGCQYTLADDEFVRKVLVVQPGATRRVDGPTA